MSGKMAVLTTQEAAAALGVTVGRIHAMIRQGLLPAQKFGRDWMIESAAVEQLKKKRRPAGRPPKKK
jgi:excisionase family DNA binding protein